MNTAYERGLSFRRYVEIGRDSDMLVANASLLKNAITPLHGKYYLDHASSGGSEALSLGDAVHKAVLEPDAFDKEFDAFYLMSPTKGLDTKKAEELRLLYPDHILVNDAIVEKVKWMREAVYRHKLAAHLLERCRERELTGIAADPAGFARKIRIDACDGTGDEASFSPYLLDLKTTRKQLEHRSVAYEIRDRGYDIQAAFYLDTDRMITGLKRDSFLFIFVSSQPPHVARVFGLTADQIQNARETYQYRLAQIADAFNNRQWEAWENESEPNALRL